jgi:hypothetical protein
MTGPVFSPQWTTPRPPKGVDGRPVRGWRVTAGIVTAILGHLVTLVAGWLVGRFVGSLLPLLTVGALVFGGCVGGGIALIVRGDRGLGIGLIAGWVGTIAVVMLLAFTTLVLRVGAAV